MSEKMGLKVHVILIPDRGYYMCHRIIYSLTTATVSHRK